MLRRVKKSSSFSGGSTTPRYFVCTCIPVFVQSPCKAASSEGLFVIRAMMNWSIVRALHVRAQNLVGQMCTNHSRTSATPSKHLFAWASTTPKVIAANRGGGGVEFSATVARGSDSTTDSRVPFSRFARRVFTTVSSEHTLRWCELPITLTKCVYFRLSVFVNCHFDLVVCRAHVVVHLVIRDTLKHWHGLVVIHKDKLLRKWFSILFCAHPPIKAHVIVVLHYKLTIIILPVISH